MKHVTVFKDEAVSALALKKDSVVVDCTLGSGGHAAAILSHLSPKGHYVGIDVDPTAIAANQQLISSYDVPITLICGNFRSIDSLLAEHGVPPPTAILADLGWRMEQFSGDTSLPRGFSFASDEPLHMTFGDPSSYSFTAADIVNDWAEEDIANVIFAYGGERFARRIAREIVRVRKSEPLTVARQLAEVVARAVPNPARHRKTHPATKTFQALRIAVNDEFSALEELLSNGLDCLAPEGRLSVISFHSLEDRIVKETFKSYVRAGLGVLVNKKPLVPSSEEIRTNPRARSAKLRTIEKLRV